MDYHYYATELYLIIFLNYNNQVVRNTLFHRIQKQPLKHLYYRKQEATPDASALQKTNSNARRICTVENRKNGSEKQPNFNLEFNSSLPRNFQCYLRATGAFSEVLKNCGIHAQVLSQTLAYERSSHTSHVVPNTVPCGLGGLEFSQRLPLCVS